MYEHFAMKYNPDDCLLPDTPITVARVAAQLAPNSLLVRIAPTKGANGKPKNEQLLTLSKDTIPRELVLLVIGHTAACAARAGKIRGAKDFTKRIAQGNRLFLQPERMAPPAIDVARHVNAAARKRFWKQKKRMRVNEGKDGDESSGLSTEGASS